MRAIYRTPDGLDDAVYLERNPIGFTKCLAHVRMINECTVRDDGNRVSQISQSINFCAQVLIQCGFTVRDKGKKINRLMLFLSQLHGLLHNLINSIHWIEAARLNLHMVGCADLTIDAGIGAVFWGNVVDPDTEP